ncbi:hypothetical protein ACFV1W_30290 [Kitasatospora sp. NPDC059648]|uniref:hypothetical protein n=1 Tax=Kitasatospora sp. NPDC059648 TaxID=3346894 RepID=UPI00369924A6
MRTGEDDVHEQQLAGPWGTVTPEFWARPVPPAPEQPAAVEASAEPAAMPEAFRERITQLMATLSTPQTGVALLMAQAEAQRLDEEITAAYGPGHQHTINARELRGWIAHLQGDHATAARWHLHTTGLQAQATAVDHPQTKATAQRTYAMWKAIREPAERAAVGVEILPMLQAVTGRASRPVKDVQAVVGQRPR